MRAVGSRTVMTISVVSGARQRGSVGVCGTSLPYFDPRRQLKVISRRLPEGNIFFPIV